MNKKRTIIITILVILIVVLSLWISGIIPKQIARISATRYLEKNFPKIQLDFVEIEWNPSFGGYSIKFKDQDDEIQSFIMNNKYFPISLGQGLFGFEEKYREKYETKNDLSNSNVVYGSNKESIKENEVNNKVTTIDIQETGLSSKAPPIKYTLNQEEIYIIFSIIDNLTFSKENCDGMLTYFIKYNSEEQEGFITYGIEKFENECHITSAEKGEAILSNEQQQQLDKIISKMYN